MTTRPALPALLLVLLVLLVAGCASLPVSGPVQHEDTVRTDDFVGAPYFDPPGPAPDASPSEVVSGFLTAQQANPLSTRVAREFLSERVRSSWQPSGGTLVYEAFTVLPSASGARLRLSDVRRLDARGGWRGGEPGASVDIEVELVSEAGQWRIDNPPSQLVVPASFFDRAFERTDLYFYDQTGGVLLPDPVFVPRGEQAATDLVRGLLAGPGDTLAPVVRSAFPSGTALQLSVVVSESGTADVPLTPDVLRAPPAELRRAADQLVATLGQVPGVQRVRMSVDGAAVPLPGGSVDAVVVPRETLAAAGQSDAPLLAVQDARLTVLGAGGQADRLAASVSDQVVAPRSFAVDGDPVRLWAVTAAGTTLLRTSLVPAAGDPGPQAVLVGTDLARPSVDRLGGAWVLDRTAAGARVVLVGRDGGRELRVPGVTGEQAVALTVAHDGSRLVVAVAGSVRVADVLRSDEGVVTGVGPAREVGLPTTSGVAEVADVGWRSPGVLAVLRRGQDTSRVDLVSVDGSPLGRDVVQPGVLRGSAGSLVVSSSVGTPLRIVTDDGELRTSSGQGTWPRTASRVSAAAYLG